MEFSILCKGLYSRSSSSSVESDAMCYNVCACPSAACSCVGVCARVSFDARLEYITNNIPHIAITSPFYNRIVYQGYISLMMIEICVFGRKTFWAACEHVSHSFFVGFGFYALHLYVYLCAHCGLAFYSICAALVFVSLALCV